MVSLIACDSFLFDRQGVFHLCPGSYPAAEKGISLARIPRTAVSKNRVAICAFSSSQGYVNKRHARTPLSTALLMLGPVTSFRSIQNNDLVACSALNGGTGGDLTTCENWSSDGEDKGEEAENLEMENSLSEKIEEFQRSSNEAPLKGGLLQWCMDSVSMSAFASVLPKSSSFCFNYGFGRKVAAVFLSAMLLVSSLPPSAEGLVMGPPRKLQADEEATVQLFRESTPSVVYITNLAVRRDVFTLDVMAVPQGSGSGFIWDIGGHVVTNYHVIRGASDLRVTLGDQSVYAADVVGYDEDKDVAVLHINAPPEKLRPLPVGSSSDLLVGQKVFAIGNPFGLDHTLTTGVISGLRREISSAATGRPIQDVIQTDAAINPGNSGGPLLDSGGNLIGINTAIYSPSGGSSGVGFSIPVDTVSGIVEQIVKFGKVTRPVLGISFAPEQSVEQLGVSGVIILDAPPSGPAGKAGLRPTTRDSYGRLILGDIITGINGQKIKNGSDLYKIMDRFKVGDTVDVEVLRGEEQLKVPVTLEPKD